MHAHRHMQHRSCLSFVCTSIRAHQGDLEVLSVYSFNMGAMKCFCMASGLTVAFFPAVRSFESEKPSVPSPHASTPPPKKQTNKQRHMSSPSLGSAQNANRRRSSSWGLVCGLSQLASLLIRRACENEEIANFLFWYLKLEAEVCIYLKN